MTVGIKTPRTMLGQDDWTAGSGEGGEQSAVGGILSQLGEAARGIWGGLAAIATGGASLASGGSSSSSAGASGGGGSSGDDTGVWPIGSVDLPPPAGPRASSGWGGSASPDLGTEAPATSVWPWLVGLAVLGGGGLVAYRVIKKRRARRGR